MAFYGPKGSVAELGSPVELSAARPRVFRRPSLHSCQKQVLRWTAKVIALARDFIHGLSEQECHLTRKCDLSNSVPLSFNSWFGLFTRLPDYFDF